MRSLLSLSQRAFSRSFLAILSRRFRELLIGFKPACHLLANRFP